MKPQRFRLSTSIVVTVSLLSMVMLFAPLGATAIQEVQALPACVPPPSGLVGWWPGDGNAEDIVNTNHGTPQNGATATEAGLVDQAFSFDGVDDFLHIPNSPSLEISGDFTIEFWFKPGVSIDSTEPVPHVVWAKGQADTIGTQNAVPTVNAYAIMEVRGPVPRPNSITNTWMAGTWYHVAVTFDSAGYRLYINGVQEGSSASTHSILSNSSSISLGWDAVNPNTPFNGSIDEASIYNRALSSSEIQDIVNAGSAGKCKTPNYRLPFAGQYIITNGPTCGRGKKQHTGFTSEAIDYALPFQKGQGAPVLAAESGTILFAGSDPFAFPPHNLRGFGTYMVIEHSDGSRSFYAHLSQVVLTTGNVTKGQLIAYSGATGKARGHPHLHFQIMDSNDNPISIRELPTTVWYSGDPNNPCNPKPGKPDGEAIGP